MNAIDNEIKKNKTDVTINDYKGLLFCPILLSLYVWFILPLNITSKNMFKSLKDK